MAAMDYVQLGNTGTKVSRLCLGCMSYGTPEWRDWVLGEEDSRPFVKRALELGVNFFDTADMYSNGASEEVLGRALKDFAVRDQVVIASKVFFPTGRGPNDRGLSRKHIRHAVEASLRRLGTDYIDLYQIHRWDPDTPIAETIDALDDLVRAGKVLYLGASSMHAWQFAQALALADRRSRSRFVTMQNHYNLIYREEEREMLPLCRKEGVGVLPWSPLARGFLAGNRLRSHRPAGVALPEAPVAEIAGTAEAADTAMAADAAGGPTRRAKGDDFAHRMYYTEPDYQVVDRVVELAGRRGVKPAQAALAWLLHQPGVTSPILGATRIEHLEEAVAALSIQLDTSELAFLAEPYQPHPVLGFQV